MRESVSPIVRITRFDDVAGTQAKMLETSFEHLAEQLCNPPKMYPSKQACPLLKMATFGDEATNKGCLRHDANVRGVWGVEGDHDDGSMTISDAAARLDLAGIRAVLFTTPSHTEEHPRWRVLAPFSREHTPQERARFAARLNGALGGVLARESFSLSQAFYFGRVEGAEYAAEAIEGDPIDTRDDLDAGAVGPNVNGHATDIAPAQDDFSRAIALRSVTAETLVELRDALMTGLRDECAESYPLWVKVGQALKSLEQAGQGAEAAELWHDFSQRSSKYDESAAEEKWDSFSPSKITFRTIFEMAQQDGWQNPRSAAALKGGDEADYSRLEDRTDRGNSNLLARLTDGNLRHVPERRLWLWWDGSRWIADEFGMRADEATQRVAQHYHGKAEDLRRQAADAALSEDEAKRIKTAAKGVDQWAAQCRNKRATDAMLSFAAKNSRLTVASADLDRDPWLFGVANGVVDLRTGQLRDDARDEFVTKRSPLEFDPKVKAARWRQFIAEITGAPLPVEYDDAGRVRPETVGRYKARPDLAAYLQRALGYCVTAQTSQHKMFIAVGPGSNGKNVLLDIVQEVLGDYCRTIPPEALMATRHDADAERPSPTAASLAGARMAISSESRDGQRLDVALVKRHTGGGYMTARAMRENTFRFEITHKLMLMTNHRPTLDHLDDALRGRLHLIPFDRVWNRPGHTERNETLPDGDPDLMEQLRAEAAGVLAWLIEGAAMFAREGLEPPREVVQMTRAYFAEQDPIGRWLEGFDRCDPKHGTGAAELFATFTAWHRDEDTGGGKAPENSTAFGEALKGRNVPKAKTKTGARYGLTVKKVTGDGL
ncbi:phage/plasmid primase, P4 family [Ralstonia pseudosolanacearum]|uniref:phage/plasmid primase, P4 family n=1 Tax=Ralstonia pseudosolanacearum TaxID=1310165 RepID=UPI00201E6143|nr:phage/plasmid primase, P4 family [Ralstonia pseudosolanacearum]UQY83669.1 PriCT-2 domain-containing protein [Ralstonia pseudosolanacearum]